MKRISIFIILCLISVSTTFSQTATYKEVPKELHGFWQFKVDNKGQWNGMHIGSNYFETYYSLAKVDSVIQKGSDYTLHFTYSNRRDGEVVIDLKDPNNAIITLRRKKPKKCKRFESDPDINILPVSEYSKVINGKWVFDNNIRTPLYINKDKLIWEEEQWNILWLGGYLKKEFRALIEKEGIHKIIYITPIGEEKIKLVFDVTNCMYYKPMPPKNFQNKLYGTWCDEKTNDWIIGIFDKIAVYQNQSWEYKILKQKKNKYTLKLQHGEQKQTLSLELKGKNFDKCKLTNGKTTHNLFYTLHSKPYNYPDTKPFVNNGYKLDSVTINGYVRNMTNDNKTFEIAVTDFLAGKQNSYYGNLDKNGCFSIKIPVINTVQIYLDWKSTSLYGIIEPDKTLFVYIDYAGSSNLGNKNKAAIWYMGENARVNQEIAKNTQNMYREDYLYYFRDKSKSMDELLDIDKNMYQRNTDRLNKYIKHNPILSERFKIFIHNYNLFHLGHVLMQNRFGLNRKTKEHFSKRYEHFTDSIFNAIPTPYTLSSHISSFLRDYIDYNIEKKETKDSLNIKLDKFIKIINDEKLYLFNKEQKVIIDKTIKINNEIETLKKEGKDSAFIAKRIAFYKKDIDAFSNLSKQKDFIPVLQEASSYIFKMRQLEKLKEGLESISMSDNMKDLLFTRKGFKDLEDFQQSLSNSEIDFLNKEIKNKEFKKQLNAAQQKYIKMEEQNLGYLELLKLSGEFKGTKDAEELWKKLTEPYLGKVIYIDVWGTWCNPCREEMKHAKNIKQAMKDKDVVFMYFANSSPEKAWRNVISQNNVIGKNVVHYNLPEKQQQMLERMLNVRSYPTFIIVDKKGEIVNMHPPRPSNIENLINELNKWLEK